MNTILPKIRRVCEDGADRVEVLKVMRYIKSWLAVLAQLQ